MSRPEAAVADAGPLIHLDELSRLNVLDVYSKVWVPGVVARETDHHRPGWQDRAPDNIERVEVAPDNVNALRAALGTKLDAGELESLAFWQSHRDASLLCDDLEARVAARELGARVIGTLGILIMAARTGRIEFNEAMTLLRSLPERTTLHITTDLIEFAVAEVKKSLQK